MRSTIFTITDEWIKQNNPCEEAIEWWDKKERDTLKILKLLIEEKRYFWANWLIVRVMNYGQNISYAVFAAEQVIDIFEKKFPDDKRPRQAIEAVRKCIDNPSKENKERADEAAEEAADAAYIAEHEAEHAAHAAAYVAAYAAYISAHEVADEAYISADTASGAAYIVAHEAEDEEIRLKILEYGMKLLEVKNE